MPPSVQPAHARSSRRPHRAEPALLRLLATLCVLLITLSACVQASHVHDDGRPAPWKSSQQHKSPDGTPTSTTDHCLLCIVMHAAMPSAGGIAPVPIRQTRTSIPVALASRRIQQVSFDLFSRPPPASPAHATEAGRVEELRAL